MNKSGPDASFVQSVKHDKFDLRTPPYRIGVKNKRTSNSYDIPSF